MNIPACSAPPVLVERAVIKFCGRCGHTNPLEMFGSSCRTKDRLQVWCKGCVKAYHFDNKERIRAKKAEWASRNEVELARKRRYYYENNKVRITEANAKYAEKNHEKVSAYKKKWAEDNQDRLIEERKNYYRANSDAIKQRVKNYALQNTDAISEVARAYRAKNREKLNAAVRVRYRTHAKARLAELTRSILKRVLRATKQKKVYGTFSMLGYIPEALKQRMEAQFQPGMSWANHGAWHIDHKIPVAHFIAKGETRPWVINALCNLQPLWAKDNLRKCSKHPIGNRPCV